MGLSLSSSVTLCLCHFPTRHSTVSSTAFCCATWRAYPKPSQRCLESYARGAVSSALKLLTRRLVWRLFSAFTSIGLCHCLVRYSLVRRGHTSICHGRSAHCPRRPTWRQ